jgi:transposase
VRCPSKNFLAAIDSADETTALAAVLTPGQVGGALQYAKLIAAVPAACTVDTAEADRSYDSDAIQADLKRRGIKPVIPPRAGRKATIAYDKKTDGQRNRVERIFHRLKQFRRVATRYDKLGDDVPGGHSPDGCVGYDPIVRQHDLGLGHGPNTES